MRQGRDGRGKLHIIASEVASEVTIRHRAGLEKYSAAKDLTKKQAKDTKADLAVDQAKVKGKGGGN